MKPRRRSARLFYCFAVLGVVFFTTDIGAALPVFGGGASSSQQIEGTWRLESLVCADGSQGALSFSFAVMDIQADTIGLTLGGDSCEVNLQGELRIDDHILTAEFNRGDWTSCSGSLPTPTYILNRFEYRIVRRKLQLIGNDLSPFASCQGKTGRLVFSKV